MQWVVEWDESQVTCQGEEQASEYVPKLRPNPRQVGLDLNVRRPLRSLSQIKRIDGKHIKGIILGVKGR